MLHFHAPIATLVLLKDKLKVNPLHATDYLPYAAGVVTGLKSEGKEESREGRRRTG